MKVPFDPVLATKAFVSGTADSHGAPIQYQAVSLGRLALPSGRIVAADPFLAKNADAFERTVPPGRYPVSFALATLFSDEVYVAYARLRFRNSNVVRWEIARVSRQEELSNMGYGVDSGVGCFVDATLAPRYAEELAEEGALERKISDRLDRFDGALVSPSFWSRDNLACFSSGRGDGVYASYFGLDAAGHPVELITDFQIANTLEPASMGADELQKALQLGGEVRERVLAWLNSK
jgi:hypothetical protein